MNDFSLNIVTPVRSLKLDNISYVRCPGLDGLFGILPSHQEGIFALSVGEVKVTKGGKSEYYSIGGGFAEIISDKIKLLVESIESSSEIDSKRASDAIERAKKRKLNQSSEHDEQRIEASLFRAMNRLKVSKR